LAKQLGVTLPTEEKTSNKNEKSPKKMSDNTTAPESQSAAQNRGDEVSVGTPNNSNPSTSPQAKTAPATIPQNAEDQELTEERVVALVAGLSEEGIKSLPPSDLKNLVNKLGQAIKLRDEKIINAEKQNAALFERQKREIEEAKLKNKSLNEAIYKAISTDPITGEEVQDDSVKQRGAALRNFLDSLNTNANTHEAVTEAHKVAEVIYAHSNHHASRYKETAQELHQLKTAIGDGSYSAFEALKRFNNKPLTPISHQGSLFQTTESRIQSTVTTTSSEAKPSVAQQKTVGGKSPKIDYAKNDEWSLLRQYMSGDCQVPGLHEVTIESVGRPSHYGNRASPY
jgi:hypothetical protein